jgi:hypothetical protein
MDALAVEALTAEGGQQGGVDVHDPAPVPLGDLPPADESGHDQQIGPGPVQAGGDPPGELRAGLAVVHRLVGKAEPARALEPEGPWQAHPHGEGAPCVHRTGTRAIPLGFEGPA